MVTDSERASRGGRVFPTGTKRVESSDRSHTNEVPVILARTDTRGVLQRVQDERFGKVVSWQNADVACSRVESVCESGEECSSFG
jgi:hypothetical protein